MKILTFKKISIFQSERGTRSRISQKTSESGYVGSNRIRRLTFGFLIALAFLAALYSAPFAQAQDTTGGIVVRVPDGESSHCINGNTDAVTLHLVRMIGTKKSGWFSADKAIGLLIETGLEGASGSTAKKVTFPRSFLIDVEEYQKGLVKLPVEAKLMSRFRLNNDRNIYTTTEFKFKVVRIRQESSLSSAVEILSRVTKKLPIPDNPFSSGFEFFIELGNELIGDFLNEKDNPDDVISDAQLALEFSPNGICSGNMATTGALAVIKSHEHGDSTVNISNEKAYCFRYVSSPTRQLQFANRTDGACPTSDQDYKLVSNPHYLLVLSAYSTTAANSPLSRPITLPTQHAPPSLSWSSPNYSDSDYVAVLNSWNQLNPSATELNSKMLSAMRKYTGIDLTDTSSLSKYGIREVSRNSGRWEVLAAYAGHSEPNADTVNIGQQNVLSYEAVAQDIASAMKRCSRFDIAADSCL